MAPLLRRPSRARLHGRLSAALLALVTACVGKTPTETETPVATPPAVGPTADDELEARLDLLAARLEEARIDNHIPGMAVAVVKDDEVIFARGFGLADLEGGREATPETLFAVGSTTKAFTSALVAMQVDAGKASWDDPITKHVPQLQLETRAPKADGSTAVPTLRDVLCHRTGFTRMSLLWASGTLPLADVLARASEAEPLEPFREKFLYNNVTYASAGAAAAQIADTTWDALLQERIFEPLGMEHSNTTVAAAQADPAHAVGYRWREVSETHEALPMRDLASIAPAGAINSNVLDMAQWIRLQLSRGTVDGKELVSKNRFEEMWTKQIDVGGGIGYGLGWMLGDWQGHRVVEHGGNIDGYAAEVGLLPDDGIGFVLLTNISATPLQRASLGIVFDSLLGDLPDPDAKVPTLDLSPYRGKYVADFGPFDDARFTVSAEGGKLFVDVPGQTKYELRPPNDQGRWVFALTDAIEVYFDLDEPGKRAQVLHMVQGGMDFELPREGYSFPSDVEMSEVAELLGRYQGEGDVKLAGTVRVEGGRLVADIDGQMAFVLHPPDEDGKWWFRASSEIAVSFRRDAKGKVDAMVIHQGGADVPLLRTKAAPVKPPTVQELLARGKAAKFEARLKTLGAVEVTGNVRMPSAAVEGRFRLVFDAERRHRVELDFGEYGRIIDTYDGTEAWSVSTLGPPTKAEGKYLRQAELTMPMFMGDWSRSFDEASVEGMEEHDGRRLAEVVLRVEELPPLRLFVDPKTGNVEGFKQVQLSEGAGGIPTNGELGGYRNELGLRMPHRIVTSNVHSGPTILEVEKVTRVGDTAGLFDKATL